MWKSLLSCYLACFLLLCQVVQAQEEGQQQPTTLKGGILKPSDTCRTTVSQNARVKMHFIARAWDTEAPFENTYSDNKPLSFKLGRDKLMDGLEKGIQGMCEGEIRRLLVPADMAFGEMGLPGKIPPNSAVVYDVEMLQVDTPLTNPWFWTGLAVIAAIYVFVSRMASQVDNAKAERFLKKQQEEQTSSSSSLSNAKTNESCK
ncbi:hypothetical protein BDB00DRAFT_821913 [Zychaea mexicana]|uniref:uncharacterized protein n=1 Tax=Zychaea mexicana TaxID=64656 RepID=UPI0022FE01BC|nr:uncharacterized protein BDB00DRAFT_821913 [Zychaea mexicana]KAI9493643.1 hypothetical protein BDB00DRAFT_821913 [Zychaea mexicana]